ncbi:hypothetical protein CEXT_629481 [Caerostris extrusa]|uniref:Uncharacterized protein n=1 Tax=Caerostris extrusa TaxID=172846 RepID=A0AAV4QM84_CAEEX|nr:hypothetical protein CEXT_629481 [Caerostris extrusa]
MSCDSLLLDTTFQDGRNGTNELKKDFQRSETKPSRVLKMQDRIFHIMFPDEKKDEIRELKFNHTTLLSIWD